MSAQRSIKSTDVAHTPRTRSAASAAPVSRRQLASSVLLQVPLLVALSRSADAKQPTNKEADNNTSPYIQELLARTEAKREERTKERLKAYMKKNYKDYFDVESGGQRGIKPETMKEIQQWMKDNA